METGQASASIQICNSWLRWVALRMLRGRGRWRPCGRRQSGDLFADTYDAVGQIFLSGHRQIRWCRYATKDAAGEVEFRAVAGHRNPPGQSAPGPAASLAGLSTGEQPRWVHCRSSRLVSPLKAPMSPPSTACLAWPRWWRSRARRIASRQTWSAGLRPYAAGRQADPRTSEGSRHPGAQVVREVMLGGTVEGEFTTTNDIAEAAAFPPRFRHSR